MWCFPLPLFIMAATWLLYSQLKHNTNWLKQSALSDYVSSRQLNLREKAQMVIPDNFFPSFCAVTLILLYLIACHLSRWITYRCSLSSRCLGCPTCVQQGGYSVCHANVFAGVLAVLSVRQWLSVAVKRHWERHRDDCRVASQRVEVISLAADPALSFVSHHLRRWQLLCQQQSIMQLMNPSSSQSPCLWIRTAVSCSV